MPNWSPASYAAARRNEDLEKISHFVTSEPNPTSFRIVQYKLVGKYLILKVHYPECTNYEGNKILVLEDAEIDETLAAAILDPHFTSSSKLIARFIPTVKGWNAAIVFASAMTHS